MNYIFDNVAFYLQKVGGVTKYWYEFLRRMLPNSRTTWMIENKNSSTNYYRKQLRVDINKIIPEKLPVFVNRYLPVSIPQITSGIFHSSYYRHSTNPKVVNIITVYDFMYEKYIGGIRRQIHSFQKGWAIDKADGVICISESTKKDLLHFYPMINKEKLRVIHLGVDSEFINLADRSLSGYDHLAEVISSKFILFVSYRGSYKNFDLVIEVLKELQDFNLIMVGGGNLTKIEVFKLKNELGTRYRHFKTVSKNELNILYNFAFCLLYPSIYEGFGIPILEAMKSGCPVICSKTSSIPEVAGNAGIMIDDIDTFQVVKKIKELENQSYREKVINLGYEQSVKFSWDNTYQQTLNYYHEVYSRKFN